MKIRRKNIKLVSSQQTIIEPPLKKTIPVYRPRRARSRIRYYKIVCMDCDLILSIQWKHESPKAFFNHFAKATTCQFCDNTRIILLEINEEEYEKVNSAWDLEDLQSSESEESNVIEGFWDLSKAK